MNTKTAIIESVIPRFTFAFSIAIKGAKILENKKRKIKQNTVIYI